MNYGIVIKVLGKILKIEALLMVPSLLVSLYYNQNDKLPFLISICIIGIIGFIMSKKSNCKKTIKAKEGLAIVTIGWFLCSLLGALPFVLSGSIPSWVDAFFETVSGLTTTGATIINNVEILPRGILFWRSFTHWIGGMGILVFTVAFSHTIGAGGFQIFKAESPGPMTDKIVPRIKDTAKILYITYFAMTILEIVLLVIGGMPLYDSTVHTFGTVGTGGYSIKNSSIGAYNSTYIHMVIAIFMMLSGVNFSLYYALFKGKWREVLKDGELRLYLGIIFVSSVLIALNINSTLYHNIGLAFRDAFFQVSSIITTTGYATANFDQWAPFSKSILLLLMFVGGCAGSTGGGIKNIRILVLLKLIKREFSKIFHPRAVIPIKTGDKVGVVGRNGVVGQCTAQLRPALVIADQRQRLRIGPEGLRQHLPCLRFAALAGHVRAPPDRHRTEAPRAIEGGWQAHPHAPITQFHDGFTAVRVNWSPFPTGGSIMGIIIWLIVGGIVGWLASIIMKRDAQQGIILNIVVGIVGALISGWLFGGGINEAITIRTFLFSLIGAVILLAIVNLFTRKSIR